MNYFADDELHLARLTDACFAEVVVEWRARAVAGDVNTRLVADALESVLRRRYARRSKRMMDAIRQSTTWLKTTEAVRQLRTRGAPNTTPASLY